MRVVNIRKERATHYIGRGQCHPSMVNTGLGNPYRINLWLRTKAMMDLDTAEVIARYEQDVRNDVRRLAIISELPEDAVLGCFCKDARGQGQCHGDVIVKLWKELHGRS